MCDYVVIWSFGFLQFFCAGGCRQASSILLVLNLQRVPDFILVANSACLFTAILESRLLFVESFTFFVLRGATEVGENAVSLLLE
jgi:hypothetical protein